MLLLSHYPTVCSILKNIEYGLAIKTGACRKVTEKVKIAIHLHTSKSSLIFSSILPVAKCPGVNLSIHSRQEESWGNL